jgi:hypothetical protein
MEKSGGQPRLAPFLWRCEPEMVARVTKGTGPTVAYVGLEIPAKC